MEVNKYKIKFKMLFDKFFQKGFELNSYYSENLLKCLEDCPDKNVEKLLDSPFFSDLLIYSLTNIENATTSIKVFILKVVSIVLKNELQFSKFHQLDGFRLIGNKVCTLYACVPPAPAHYAVLKLLETQTTHYSGITWIIENKIWRYILNAEIHHQTNKVARAAYDCIAKLVWRLNEYDEETALIELLQFIVHPIKTSQYNTIRVLDAETEKAIADSVLSYLHTLLAIVSNIESNEVGANKVIPLLTRYFIVEANLHLISEKTRDTEMMCLLSHLLFRLAFGVFRDGVARNLRPETDIAYEMITVYYNIVMLLLKKRMTSAAVDFLMKSLILWAKVDDNVIPPTFERYGRTFDIRIQLMILIVAPLLWYSYNPSDKPIIDYSEAIYMKGVLDVYLMKLVSITTEHIVKVGYLYRTLLESGDAKIIILKTLRDLFKLKGYLNVAQAGLLYQALFHILQRHITSDGSGGLIVGDSPLKSPDDVKLITLVLDAIKMLLNEYNINWYENVEVICLQTCLVDLLKQNFMPTKQLLQAIELIELSVKRFLSPDMTLLMESKQGSTLNEVCVVMKQYIQHEEWEVRDSALQFLLSCAEVAFIKYIPLQKLLSENNLVILAAHAALSDDESYVQVTALRCLAAATKIGSLWREVLMTHPNLYVQLTYILSNHHEGLVRKEAATVLTEVYVNRTLPSAFTKIMYSVMAAAALNDLHWEVQIAALKFWKHATQNHMSYRGMIDGKFPSVTFSKEKRKIIVLNEKEIMRQLDVMLTDLSSIGCLTVLHNCLKDEFNIDVIEQAYNVTKDIKELLYRYKYETYPSDKERAIRQNDLDSTAHDVSRTITAVAMDLSYVPTANQYLLRDQIIDSIVNTSQQERFNLLCENSTHIKSNAMEDDEIPIPIIESMDPNKFLKDILETNYMSIIEGKKKWICGPSSMDILLDEILTLGEEKNDICYECS